MFRHREQSREGTLVRSQHSGFDEARFDGTRSEGSRLDGPSVYQESHVGTETNNGPKTPGRQRWMADACLLLTAVCWGINIPVFKFAMSLLNPWVFNAIRLVFATIALGVCVAIENRVVGAKTAAVPWRRVLLFSCMSGLVYQLVFVMGIHRTTAGNTALLLSSMPMWTAVISFFFIGERLPRITWVGLFITFIGTIIVTTQSGTVSLSSQYFTGNLLMLSAAIVWATGTVLSRPILSALSPLRLAFYSSLLTLPFHILFAANEYAAAWPNLQKGSVIAALLYSGVMSTGVAYATWHVGVRQLGGSHAAVYQNVVTLIAVLGGWLFLYEQPTPAQMIGGAFMIVGMLAMRRGRR